MITIFKELAERAAEKPIKMIADAWNNRLANSLDIAVECKIRDAIRTEKAKKRYSKDRILQDYEEEASRGWSKIPLALQTETFLEKIIGEEEWEDLASYLEEDEKTVLIKLFKEEFNENEVATQLGKSQAWVSIVKNKAIDKLSHKLGDK